MKLSIFMFVKVFWWSALWGKFLFMMRLWEHRRRGRERHKEETILGHFWLDFKRYDRYIAFEDAFCRNSCKGSIVLKSYCIHFLPIFFSFFKFPFLCLLYVFYSTHNSLCNFPSFCTASFFRCKHTLHSANVALYSVQLLRLTCNHSSLELRLLLM